MASGDSKIVRKLTRGQLYLEEMSLDVDNIFRDFQNKLLEPSRKNIPIKNGGNLGGITVTGSKSAKKTPYKWSSPRGSGNMTFTGNSVAIPILEGLGHVGKAFTKGVSSFAASASSTPTMGGYNNPYVPYTHFNQDVLNLVENILDEKVLPAVTPTNYLAALFTEGSLDPYRGAEIKSHWSPIMLLSSVPVDILAAKGTIKSGPKVIKTTANGVKTATKAVDNAVREFYPAYDLYRTIGETTPRTTPTIHAFNIDKKYFAMTGSPLFEFARMMRTSPEKAYFMRAPKDVDVLRLNNGSFRHEVVGNEIFPSGEVNGKFVSYGEPWKEFGFGENDALYEFPIGPRRGPSLMATDWKGRLREYSVDEIYDYMQKEEALNEGFRKDVTELGLDKLKGTERVKAYRALKEEKYPELLEGYDTSIYGANQTVISNKKWNFDKFLKSPFWKYSENPITGLVQKELFIQLPQINLNPNRTSLRFFERRPSRITEAERAGVSKGDRNLNYNINSDKVYGNLRFIRNIDGLPNVEGGKVQLGNPSKLLTNFTTDLPFRLHAWYPNISGPTYMIVSPRAFKGKRFFSIKPSDSFLDAKEAEVTPNLVRIISGDPRILREAENKGMRTLTSDRLQNLFKLGSEINLKEYDLGMNGAVRNFLNTDHAADNLQWRDIHIDYPKEGVVTPYRAEVDKLITLNFGRPSIKDYLTLLDITGLDAGVTTEFNPEFLKNAIDPLATKDMFNDVYYSVTSPIEEQLMNSIGLYPGPYYNFSNWLKLSKLKGNKLTYKQGGKINLNELFNKYDEQN